MHLTDDQWELIEPLIPPPPQRPDRRGRPWAAARPLFEAVLWVLRSGARWTDLPADYPPPATAHRRYQLWVDQGVFARLAAQFAHDLHLLGELDLGECFIDGSFVEAKAGGTAVGPTKAGKGSKIMVIVDAQGLPVSVAVTNATPHEVTLVETTLTERFVNGMPARLIGDKAYDSDGLDATLAAQGITMIAPHRRNRHRATQDGRTLRRYTRRWKVERFFSWLQHYRHLMIRYEYYVENFLGFVHLACAFILLRRILNPL